MDSSPPPTTPRLKGTEPFHQAGMPLPFDVLDFWRWSASDLTSNTLRGRLAEYLVARALDLPLQCRVEWDACDLRLADGTPVEVKSAAYVQAWQQTRPSRIAYRIQPAFAWDARTNTTAAERRRSAAVYVFCLLHHTEPATLDPLDLSQWIFYVLPTPVLDERYPEQKTISLASLRALGPAECSYDGLAVAVREAAAGVRLPEA